ncbi:MAG: hypothetical protein K8S62_14015 [Candidatus Sabulitectum sp.]|nr:hypothetical protein [Candidatus Sabulitectum sp.]
MATLSSIILLCNLSVSRIDTFVTGFMEHHHAIGLSACTVVLINRKTGTGR